MDVDRWSVLLVANSCVAWILAANLTRAGACPGVITNSEAALAHPALDQTNIVVVTLNLEPIRGVEWVSRFRRLGSSRARKAPVIMLADGLTASLAEECAMAGSNAVIGLPLGPRTLVKTIKRVFAHPKPFVKSATYVGPCNLSGIVTAWPSSVTARVR
jgi:two-component system chemotaxis response regulator CheY